MKNHAQFDRIKKCQGACTKHEAYKLVYMWVKQQQITTAEFVELIGVIEDK